MLVMVATLGLCGIFIAVLVFNFVTCRPDKKRADIIETLPFSTERVAEKLSEALQVKTISYVDREKIDYSTFLKYHTLLEVQFPEVHNKLKRTVINDYSLIFYWASKNTVKKPILLMSHMDVVPVESGTDAQWKQQPFSGEIADNYIWGRGAIDTKITGISILEAVEVLLENRIEPDRDIYIAFGHDEEIQGHNGARKIAAYFEEKKIHFEYTIDEGGLISEDSISQVDLPVALVGICEKGYADIKLTVAAEGGHASMPPRPSAMGKLSQLIANLEKKQMKPGFQKTTISFFKSIAPYTAVFQKLLLSNLWLFKPLLQFVLLKTRSGNAMLRTTTAVTMAQASDAPNVLPQNASITVNHRIIPGETVDDLLRHIKTTNKDLLSGIEVLKHTNPSEISSIDSQGFLTIKKTIQSLFKDVVVAPYMVMAGTDSKYMGNVSTDVYRFAPIIINSEEISKIHSTNERISIENVERSVRFFMELIRNS